MLKICNFSSGSDGNCTYVEVFNSNNSLEAKPTRILIDAGISASNIVANLKKLSISPSDINAIIITHEHSDHIKGLDVFASKYGATIHAHQNLWGALNKKLTRTLSLQKKVFYSQDFEIGSAKIQSVQVSHDATHTSAFSISDGKNSVSIMTDLGEFDQEVLSVAFGSSVVYLESNHDEKMLRENQNYPFYLKSRILSTRGHLSNTQCAQAIEQLVQKGTKQFVLSHLSTHNNTPDLAYETVCAYLATKGIIEGKHLKIDVASTKIGSVFKTV
jgi:phosphoribosyl 1,2-cyclic phosphodiesterase